MGAYCITKHLRNFGTLNTLAPYNPAFGGGNFRLWVPFRSPPRPTPNQRIAFLVLGQDGTVVDTVDFPRITDLEGPTSFSAAQPKTPLHPRIIWAWSPKGTYAVARTDQYRIEISPIQRRGGIPAGGTVPNDGFPIIISRSVPQVVLSKGERRSLARELEGGSAARRQGRQVFLGSIPTAKPFLRSMFFSQDGWLWARVSKPSTLVAGRWVEPRAYDVFDSEGRFRGQVVAPGSFRVLGARGSRLLGVHRGELGVESIRVYGVKWPNIDGTSD